MDKSIVARSIEGSFNGLFLGELIGFGAVFILFLFYFNRLLASLLSLLIRAYTWYFYRVYVDIQSIQVSLLGGRVFFKNIRYHGRNETILIGDGYITWRYWLRKVREVDLRQHGDHVPGDSNSSDGTDRSSLNAEAPGKLLNDPILPCRIVATLRGVEWFIYNRIPAYDAILASVVASTEREAKPKTPQDGPQSPRSNPTVGSISRVPSKPKNSGSSSEERGDISENHHFTSDAQSQPISRTSTKNRVPNEVYPGEDLPALIRLLPLGVQCSKGAIVMGNDFTQNILVAKFENAQGCIDAQPTHPQDRYRQVFDFEFTQPIISLKPNNDYKCSAREAGAKSSLDADLEFERRGPNSRTSRVQQRGRVVLDQLYNLLPLSRGSVESFHPRKSKEKARQENVAEPRNSVKAQNRWLGLSRYVDDDEDMQMEQERWKSIEYARVNTLLDCPKIGFRIFWDIPGKVALSPHRNTTNSSCNNNSGRINGSDSPGWGIDLSLSGGVINYGPWADRQRAELQSVFFPSSYTESPVMEPLKEGQVRVSTVFKVTVTVERQVTLRLVTREGSKDWKWRNHLAAASDVLRTDRKMKSKAKVVDALKSELRPAGWLDLSVAENSAISYSMDMFASEKGFQNGLSLDLKLPQITSSVNHDILLSSKSLELTCDLSNPRQWNALREWRFNISSDHLQLFMLRDHIFLMIDMIGDWTSGPPNDFFAFVPFVYTANIELRDFCLNLNINDSNIISNPSSLDDNAFLSLSGPDLSASIRLPSTEYRPARNEVNFSVRAATLAMQLRTPLWNTLNTLLEDNTVASLPDLDLQGSYSYFTSTSYELTDHLLLNVHGTGLDLQLYGFLIRDFLTFKENYFGDNMHFRTLEEHNQRLASGPGDDVHDDGNRLKLTNDLDVILTISVDDGCVSLPSRLFSAQENIKAEISSISVDLRFTNYYMDIEISFSPLVFTRSVKPDRREDVESPNSSAQLFLDGIAITGHRLFGLPPTEPTYICNWDFEIGQLTGECSNEFLASLLSAGQCFIFHAKDLENALPNSTLPVLHDVTFLRVKAQPIDIWFHVKSSAFLLATEPIDMVFNDLAGTRFSERICVKVPKLTVAAIDPQSFPRNRARSHKEVVTHALLESSFEVRMVESKAKFFEQRALQQNHIRLHDSRTLRTQWLTSESLDNSFVPTANERSLMARPPAMPFPPMPAPLTDNLDDELHSRSSSSSGADFPSHLATEVNQNGPAPNPDPIRAEKARPRGERYSSARETFSTSAKDPSLMPVHTYLTRSRSSETSEEPRDFSSASKSRLAFSSSFDVPYFPLQSVNLNARGIPRLDELESDEDEGSDIDGLGIEPSTANSNHVETTLIIRVAPGCRAIITPKALLAADDLLSSLQAKDMLQTIDQLHIGAISKVADATNPQKVPKITQIKLSIPIMAIRFQSETGKGDKQNSRQQQYDFEIKDFSSTVRLADLKEHGDKNSHVGSSLLHFSITGLEITANEIPDSEQVPVTKIKVCWDDVIFWYHDVQRPSGQLQFKTLEARVVNRDVRSLALLVQDTISIADAIGDRFRNTISSAERHQRQTVLALATSHEDEPDPAFLNAPASVLRSSSANLRNSDSWKMIARLRNALRCFPAPDQTSDLSILDNLVPRHSPDALAIVVAAFQRWRGWDLHNVKNTPLLKEVFKIPSQMSKSAVGAQVSEKKFALNAATVKITIDPSPSPNEIKICGIAATVKSIPSPNQLSLQPGSRLETAQDIILELTCSEASVSLNLDVLDVMEGLLRVPEFHRTNTVEELRAESLPISREAYNIQMILVLESVSVNLKGMNVEVSASGQRSMGHLILKENKAKEVSLNLFAKSDQLVSTLSSPIREVAIVLLQNPNLHVCLQRTDDHGKTTHTWMLGALCDRASANLKEDMLGLLGFLDRLVADELPYLQDFSMKLKKARPKKSSRIPESIKRSSSQGETHNIIYGSLLLESYDMSATLVSSMRYSIYGKVARSTCKPIEEGLDGLMIDFDLKKNVHALENLSKGELDEITSLLLPPANGRISIGTGAQKLTVIAHIALEAVIVDASSLHGFFSALSRREVSNFKQNVAKDYALVMSNYRNKTMKAAGHDPRKIRKREETKLTATDITFRVSGIVAGLTINASTSRLASKNAHLALELGRVSFKAFNEDPQGHIVILPEIRVGLNRIKILLEKVHGRVRRSCGDVTLAVSFHGTSKQNEEDIRVRSYEVLVDYLEINLYAETASMIVDILGYLQQRFKNFSLSDEINTLRARRLRTKSQVTPLAALKIPSSEIESPMGLFSSMYSLEMNAIQISWRVGDLMPVSPGHGVEDLIFSIEKVELATKRENAARLMMKDLLLQMVPTSQSSNERSLNSALMPEVLFNVAYLSTPQDRRLAFQAAGKSVDLRISSKFIIPARDLQRSIGLATRDLRKVVADWNASFIQDEQQNKRILGNKALTLVLVDMDFDGAVVYFQGQGSSRPLPSALKAGRAPQPTTSFTSSFDETINMAVLRTPGIAIKVEYNNYGVEDPALHGEVKIDASANTLYPTIVPLIQELSESVKEIVGEPAEAAATSEQRASAKFIDEDILQSTDPVAILGRCRLNLGLRICSQEFGLSCQPIAKVFATGRFEDIYVTINTVQGADQSRFFAISGVIKQLQASVQHAYSRTSTGSFEASSVELSLMNSRHVSNVKGLFAIINFGPMKAYANTKQLHDFFIFREIWMPIGQQSRGQRSPVKVEAQQPFGVQRYQQVATVGSFPWSAILSISQIDVELDLGQALGRAAFTISGLWASSKKQSDWEQNLFFGFDKVGLQSSGRLSSFLELRNLRLRTSIHWPDFEKQITQTPLVQASLGFDDLRSKVAFEYQTFAVMDFSSLEFLMYNVRSEEQPPGDRLICIVNSNMVQAYCTTQSPAQVVSIYQAVQKLVQEMSFAYESSLNDIERIQRRKSSASRLALQKSMKKDKGSTDSLLEGAPFQLHTNVMVTLKALNVGAYPKAFSDNTIFKLEALEASAAFSVAMDGQRVQSGLTLKLGQVRIALSNISKHPGQVAFEEISVDDVVKYSTGSRGGTILKVPRVVAVMQTWQNPGEMDILYIFKSTFEGRVEVGWNINRINVIRGMWESQSKALAQRLGKALPQSAVQITGVPLPDGSSNSKEAAQNRENAEKITAVVNVPVSRYQYTAKAPPIIETPQLRDMGEATPPLEWIGLHRDRLPNITHQIIIVPLLEIAREVEDAYSKILGA